MINLLKKEKFFIFATIFIISLTSFSIVQAACVDTDGHSFTTSGTCTDYRGTPFNDYCNADYAIDYWCADGVGGACDDDMQYCPYGCSDGGICNPTPPCSGPTSPNIYKKEVCTGADNIGHWDTCSGNSVVDYYCGTGGSAGYCLSNTQDCGTYGCFDGTCLAGPCFDSDGPQNFSTYGYCTDYFGGSQRAIYDYCECGTYAVDYYCNQNVCTKSTWNCGVDQCTDSGVCYVTPFDFSIAVDPTSGSVIQGSSISTNVNLGLVSGTTQSVNVGASVTGGWPAGMSATFPSGSSCGPACSLVMTITTTASTPNGTTTINVCGQGGSQNHCTTYQITVVPAGTQITPPSVTTSAATSIAQISATLNGTLNSMGGATSCLVWFEWGPTTSLGNLTSVQTKSATGGFSASISGLTAGQTYYFKAFAKNGGSW